MHKYRNVGIFHETPVSAAQKMIEVWDAVESWWISYEGQNVRKKFCDMFANTSGNPIRELVSLFRKTTSSEIK